MSASSTGQADQPDWPAPGSSISWFEGTVNADKSEGRGATVTVKTHVSDPLACHAEILRASTQGEDGDVHQVWLTVRDDGSVQRSSKTVYGSTYSTANGGGRSWRWGHGFEHLNVGDGDQRGRHVPRSLLGQDQDQDQDRVSVAQAIDSWETHGRTSLTMAVMVDALYGVAHEFEGLPPANFMEVGDTLAAWANDGPTSTVTARVATVLYDLLPALDESSETGPRRRLLAPEYDDLFQRDGRWYTCSVCAWMSLSPAEFHDHDCAADHNPYTSGGR